MLAAGTAGDKLISMDATSVVHLIGFGSSNGKNGRLFCDSKLGNGRVEC
jgi:hypothetical protein